MWRRASSLLLRSTSVRTNRVESTRASSLTKSFGSLSGTNAETFRSPLPLVDEKLNMTLEQMRREAFPVYYNDLKRIMEYNSTQSTIQALNRNARKPKKANHGKRPCSHVRRRSKRTAK